MIPQFIRRLVDSGEWLPLAVIASIIILIGVHVIIWQATRSTDWRKNVLNVLSYILYVIIAANVAAWIWITVKHVPLPWEIFWPLIGGNAVVQVVYRLYAWYYRRHLIRTMESNDNAG